MTVSTQPIACETIIYGSMLVTQDVDRRIVENAGIVVTEGCIVALGTRADCAGFQPRQTFDLGNSLLMPGLVNSHTHVAMTFLRGFADDLPLMDWLNQYIFPVEKHLTAEIVELGALLGCAEMARTGTTAFADMYLLEDAVCEAVDKSGLKILAGEVIFAFPSPAYASTDAAFSLVRRMADRYAGHSRIRIAVMPHTLYTTTPDILRGCHSLAEERNLTLHLHLAETPAETAICRDSFSKRPVSHAYELGLLTPRTTLAHAVDLTAPELDLLASSGVAIAHNPKSNMKLASGVASIPAMLERGILPGLGTDGAASNNVLNMFSEMSVCALLHKVYGASCTAASAQMVLDMATLGGAKALHWDGLGSLFVGGPADIIALDLTTPNLQPMYNPVSHLVYAASGHEVCFTMVDGEVLYQDGRFTRIDYTGLLAEIARLREWVESKRA